MSRRRTSACAVRTPSCGRRTRSSRPRSCFSRRGQAGPDRDDPLHRRASRAVRGRAHLPAAAPGSAGWWWNHQGLHGELETQADSPRRVDEASPGQSLGRSQQHRRGRLDDVDGEESSGLISLEVDGHGPAESMAVSVGEAFSEDPAGEETSRRRQRAEGPGGACQSKCMLP